MFIDGAMIVVEFGVRMDGIRVEPLSESWESKFDWGSR